MPVLQVIKDAPGFCKATFQGPQGSGKTFTATKLAVRIHQLFGSKKPIAFYDTEIGSDYIAHLIKEETGMDPIRVKSRAFSVLGEAGQECVAGAADILLVDSISHVWRELQAAHMEAVNAERVAQNWKPKARMDIQDIMKIKERWQVWPDFFLNSPLHIIVCGREGAEWGNQENEETGKMELIQVGKKMKVEGEFGYEASLMVSMSIRQNQSGWVKKKGSKPGEAGERKPQEMVQVATVLKDRFDELNGQTVEMPEGVWFDPFLKRLKPELHRPVNTTDRTPIQAESSGYDRSKGERDIALEKIQEEIVRGLPGTTAAEKKLKGDVLEVCFNTRSWTEITTRRTTEQLKIGLDTLTLWMKAVAERRADGIDVQVAVDETKHAALHPEAASAGVDDDLPPAPMLNGQAREPNVPPAELFLAVIKQWSGVAADEVKAAARSFATTQGRTGIDGLSDEAYDALTKAAQYQHRKGTDFLSFVAMEKPLEPHEERRPRGRKAKTDADKKPQEERQESLTGG